MSIFCGIFRAESLASEIRDLQGELGDYNTVSYRKFLLDWRKFWSSTL
jgi:hypothetical protein